MQHFLILSTILLFGLYATLIIYYTLAWQQIKNEPPIPSTYQPTTKISIIIPARNEAENIGNCLHSIIQQQYPNHLFEIIVVDDFSTDDTPLIVKSYQTVRLISLQNFVSTPINSYKKKAIELAIQQASGDLIVTTDADCIVNENWLLTIATYFEKTAANFIAMPVLIVPNKQHSLLSIKFLEIFQALDFMTLQGVTGAAVSKKMMNMCNGANLAYTKKIFYQVGGFAGIDSIASGDDMLLMQKISKQNKAGVHFLKSPAVIVKTAPMQSVSSFINQRIRWASKADKYDDKKIIAVLLIVYLFNCLLFLLPIVSILKIIRLFF